MYPYIFGFIDSYVLMIAIGIFVAFALVAIYFRHRHFSKRDVIDALICASFAVAFGVLFALLFQALYDLKWQWKLTFFGGLIGGVFGYLLTYYLFVKKESTMRIDEVVIGARVVF